MPAKNRKQGNSRLQGIVIFIIIVDFIETFILAGIFHLKKEFKQTDYFNLRLIEPVTTIHGQKLYNV